MTQSNFKYLFATSVKCSDCKISPFVYKLAKTYPFRDCGFHTPVEWKIEYNVINKQVIVQILIVNTTFYMYGNIRLKEISITNVFEQIQENTMSGSAFSALLGSSAVSFIPDRPVYIGSKPLSRLIQQATNWYFCCCFFQKTGFDIPCKLSMEAICMKCQNLFSGKSKKNISIRPLLSAENFTRRA